MKVVYNNDLQSLKKITFLLYHLEYYKSHIYKKSHIYENLIHWPKINPLSLNSAILQKMLW